MRKVISLILLLAIAFSINVFATPSTEIYFSMNFDDYNSVSDFISKFSTTTYTLSGGSMSAAGEMLTISKDVQDKEGATGGLYSVGGKSFSNIYMAFEKNSFGRKTLKTTNTSLEYNAGAGFIVVPKKSFKFDEEENKEKIFIISYDLEVNGSGIPVENYHTDQTYWTDPLKEKTLSLNTMWKKSDTNGGVNFNINLEHRFNTGVKGYTFGKGKTYRVAYGYGYGDGNEHTDYFNWDTYGQTYYAPTRYYYRDGGAWTGDTYKSTKDYGSSTIGGIEYHSHAFINKPVLYAFTLTWAGDYGIEYGDILAYTVSTDENTFGASLVNDVVELGGSAYIKFSQPIAPNTAVKDAFSITENGNQYDLYEIGEIKTVIETTGEVGSVVEITFPYGLKAGAEYNINVHSSETAVKSEIMRTIKYGDSHTFTVGAAPEDNAVSISAKSGLTGDSPMTNIVEGQAKFTAKADSSETPSFLFIGIYDGTQLVSYTYTKATTDDILSLSSEVKSGYTVKAYSCGCLYDLSQAFTEVALPDVQ